MKYYKVVMVRGHQGRGVFNSTLAFYYEAPDAITACKRAQRQGGVKHSRLPLSCVEVCYEEYYEMIQISAYQRGFCK